MTVMKNKKIYLQNLHTHSTYCDGENTIEEMIVAACEKGFDSIGFSSHSYLYEQLLSESKLLEYKQEISTMKKKYADKIDIYCGLECEMSTPIDCSDCDYLIGAVHYLPVEEDFLPIDSSLQELKNLIEKYFQGNGMVCAKAYYQQLAKLPEYGDFDFIAHFDLITKYCEQAHLFDCQAKEYRWAAIETAEQLVGKIPYFEVNTGAISRGYRTTPYPDIYLLKELRRLGFGVIISTDCHDSRFLDCA